MSGVGAVVLDPTSLSFLAVGASYATGVTASETGYSGAFTPSTAATGQANSCNGIATISGSGNSFTVSPVAAGTCTFTFSGATGHTATLPVTVTTTTVGGS